MTELELITDIMIFISGIIMAAVAGIFLILYRRHRRRDYFIISLICLIFAFQGVLGEFDVLLAADNEFLDFIAAVLSVIITILIITVLLFPHRVPVDFLEVDEE